MGTNLKVISLLHSKSEKLFENTFENAFGQYFSIQSHFKDQNQDGVILIVDDQRIYTAFVVDGMGGHQGGDIATSKVLECCNNYVDQLDPLDQRLMMMNIMESSDREIKELKLGAGATITAIEFGGDFVRFYNAGDAFGLLMGPRGKLKYKTIEHSPLGFGIEAGIVERDDEKIESHVVSNGLGLEPMRIEMSQKLSIKNNDLICLGSDGILNNFKIDDVIDAIVEGEFELRMEKLLSQLLRDKEQFLHDDTSLLLFKLNV